MINDNVQWTKYSDESLDFILQKSEILLANSVVSHRETTNKCFVLCSIAIGLMSFCFTKIISCVSCVTFNALLICFLGCVVCLISLFFALMPSKIGNTGILPSLLLTDEFERIEDNFQLRYYKENVIEQYEKMIENNYKRTEIKSIIFISSFCILFLSVVIYLSVYFWSFFLVIPK